MLVSTIPASGAPARLLDRGWLGLVSRFADTRHPGPGTSWNCSPSLGAGSDSGATSQSVDDFAAPGTDRGQELEPLVAFAAGVRGEDDEGLELVRVQEGLPVEFEDPELGMPDALGFAVRADHRVLVPDAGELAASCTQRVDKGAGWGVLAGARVDRGELRGQVPAVVVVVFVGEHLAYLK